MPNKNKENKIKDGTDIDNINEEIPQKRGRGRPKKELPVKNIVNEGKKSITMTEETNSDTKAENIQYTIDGLNERWKTIFSRNSNRTFSELMGAWQNAWSMLYNPFIQNQRIKQIIAQGRKATKEDLQNALLNPENSEYNLQQISFGLYYSNYFYNQLIKIDRNTPRYNWYVLPEYITKEDAKTDVFKKESIKADRIMKAFKPSLTFKTIATQVAIEGKSAYLPRYSIKDDGTVDFFVLQKLNTNEVKLTGFGSEQQFVASFNMVIFLNPMYDIRQYPPFIRKVWNEMNSLGMIVEDKNGRKVINPKANNMPGNGILEWDGHSWAYWVQLPQDLCYVFYTDGGHPNAFPDMIGMFDDFNDLDDYKWLQQSLMTKGVNSVLTAEVPLIQQAKLNAGQDQTAISPDTVLGYTDLFSSSVSGNIMAYFAPFTDFKLHSVEAQPEALDVIYDRTRDLLASSGNANLLPITDKPSIASVVTARLLQESKVDYLTRQFEEFLNNMFEKEFEFRYHWKVHLWGGIFKKDDEIKQLKEMVTNGYEGMLPKLLSAFNYSVEDYKSSKIYLDTLEIKPYKSFEIEKMKLQSELSIKVNKAGLNIKDDIKLDEEINEEKKRGRPVLEDGDVMSESTEIARNNGQDTEQKDASNIS